MVPLVEKVLVRAIGSCCNLHALLVRLFINRDNDCIMMTMTRSLKGEGCCAYGVEWRMFDPVLRLDKRLGAS